MIDKPAISSALLGITAYEQAQGRQPAHGLRMQAAGRLKGARSTHTDPKRSERSSKELKVSVLKSLQTQSNSGMVKIRDVASALDALLKSS